MSDQILGNLKLILSADSSKLRQEMQASEQFAKAQSQAIAKQLGGSVDQAAAEIARKRGTFQGAVAQVTGGDYSKVGRDIGNSIANSIQSSLKQSSLSMSGALNSMFAGVGMTIGQSLARAMTAPIQSGFNFIGDSINQAQKIETLTTSLRFVSGTAQEAATNMKFLRESSDQLGYSLTTLIPGFNSLAASTRGTNMEGQATRDLFLSIVTAGRTLGLSSEQVKNALVAVSQMASKGVISMEELRGQLGEALPGALQIFARAMGVSVQQFTDMVGKGQLGAESLKKFSAQIMKEMGGTVPESMKTAAAASSQFENTISKLQEQLGKAVQPAVLESTKFLSQTLNELQNSQGFDALASEAQKFASYLRDNPKYAQLLGQAINELLVDGLQALTIEAERFLKYLEENPDAIKQGIQTIGDFGSLLADAVRFAAQVARTLKDWDAWLGKSNDRFNEGSQNLQRFIEQSQSVLATWGGVVQKISDAVGLISGISGLEAMKLLTGGGLPDALKMMGSGQSSSGGNGERILKAIMGQESGGDPRIVNSDSGALGLYQIMPENLPSWSKAALGREVGRDEFLKNPEIQTKIASHQMQEMFKTAMASSGGSEAIAVRKVAAEWYSGQQSLFDDGKPQYYGGNAYPSIRDYTLQVLDRYQGIPKGGATGDNNLVARNPRNQIQPNLTPTASSSSASSAVQPIAEKKYFPVIGNFDQTSGYGMREHPVYGGQKFHDGIDLGTPIGTPVVSPMAGKVIRAGGTQDGSGEYGGYGKLVEVQFADKTTAFFAHLSEIAVKVGEEVAAGQLLAKSGNSGIGTGAHLHVGASDKSGKSTDPSYLLQFAKINEPVAGGKAGSMGLASLESQQAAAEEARKRLQQQNRSQMERLQQERRQREQEIQLQQRQEDQALSVKIAEAGNNSQLKSALENQRSVVQERRQVESDLRKAMDDLKDLESARSLKVENIKLGGTPDGVDYAAAISKQKQYIAGLQQLQQQAGKAPQTEWLGSVTKQTQELLKATEQQAEAVVGLGYSYEQSGNPTIEHQSQLQRINQSYREQAAAIEETVKAAKQLEAVSGKSDDLSRIIQAGESNLQRLSEGRQRAITVAQSEFDKAQKQREQQRQLDQMSALATRRDAESGGKIGLLQGMIGFGQTIGSDTRELQKESALLQESLRFEQQIEGLKQLEIQGKISTITLQDLTSKASQLNKINLGNINAQFNEFGGIVREQIGQPLKGFFTDLLTGTKSVGDAFRNLISSLLNSLANLAINKLFQSLFKGIFGGGIFNAKDGGTVPNFKDGGPINSLPGSDYRSGYGEISKALQREGPNAVLLAATPGEEILDVRKAAKYRKMFPNGIDNVANFAAGGTVGSLPGAVGAVTAKGNNQNITLVTNVTVPSNSNIDPGTLKAYLDSRINDALLKAQEPGGALNPA